MLGKKKQPHPLCKYETETHPGLATPQNTLLCEPTAGLRQVLVLENSLLMRNLYSFLFFVLVHVHFDCIMQRFRLFL